MSASPGSNLFKQLLNRQCNPNIYKFQPYLFRERLRLAKNLYKTDLIAHYGCVNAIEFSNGGKYLVSGGDDKRVILWDLEKSIAGYEKPISMDKEHQSNIFCLGFDNNNSKIFSGGNDELVIIHDFETKKVLDVFVHQKPVYGLSVDPSCDSILATACEDGKITIYDERRGVAVQTFGKFGSRQASYHAVQFHPQDGNFVVTANTRKGAAFWDLRSSNRPVIQYGGEENQQSCMSVRFNSNGTLVLALRRRLPPILYNTFSQKPICQFYHPDYYNSCTMKSCCFAGGDDEYVLSGSDDFNLYVWKVNDIDLELNNQWIESTQMVLYGHRSIVNQVRYNPEKCLLASSGVEKIVKLWSPFNQRGWSGSLIEEVAGPENPREVFSHDAYVTLVNANMSHDYSTQNTQEDSRMMAFFDSLIQQEIEGWNTNYSTDSEQNSIPSSGQSTRHNSSTDDSDDNRAHYFSNSRERNRRGLNVNSIKPQRNKYTNRIAYLIATKRNTLRRLALKGASNSNRRRRQNSIKTKRKNQSSHHLHLHHHPHRTTRNGNISSKRTGRFASSMSYRSRMSGVGAGPGGPATSSRGGDDNESQTLKNSRHKRYEAVFRALRRKHRNRRQLGPSDTSSEEENVDVSFNYEPARSTNLAIPSTSTGITSSGRDIIIRLRQQEQLLDSDTADDDDDNSSHQINIVNTNRRNQITPIINGHHKNNHTTQREHETEENGSSTSSTPHPNNDDNFNNSSDTNNEDDVENDNQNNNFNINNNNNNSSLVSTTPTTSAIVDTTSSTTNNRKRCHALNLDILYSSHSNSRLSNSSYLEDDNNNSSSNESLDCFVINKKIKINNDNVPESNHNNNNDDNHNNDNNNNDDIDGSNNLNLYNNKRIITEEAKTPSNGDRQNINNNNNLNDSDINYLNTPDSGISLATASSAGCSSTSNRKKLLNDLNTINMSGSNNNNIQNGDKFSIKLFHQKVARVRRNYRKKFGDDSDSD